MGTGDVPGTRGGCQPFAAAPVGSGTRSGLPGVAFMRRHDESEAPVACGSRCIRMVQPGSVHVPCHGHITYCRVWFTFLLCWTSLRVAPRADGSAMDVGNERKPAMKACLFAGDRLVLAEGAADLPSLEEAKRWEGGRAEWFRVGAGADAVMAARLSGQWKAAPGVTAMGLRAVLPLLREPFLSLALTAAHLARWRRTSRYCGVCGTATRPLPRHQAMLCPSCGHLAFPKVSPAVIVQVTRGDRILLGRSRRHPHGSYSVLAGFVDPGESLEDAVRREIEEESGIRVGNIRYFGSIHLASGRPFFAERPVSQRPLAALPLRHPFLPSSIIRERSPPGWASGRPGRSTHAAAAPSTCGPAARGRWRGRGASASRPSGRPSTACPGPRAPRTCA